MFYIVPPRNLKHLQDCGHEFKYSFFFSLPLPRFNIDLLKVSLQQLKDHGFNKLTDSVHFLTLISALHPIFALKLLHIQKSRACAN